MLAVSSVHYSAKCLKEEEMKRKKRGRHAFVVCCAALVFFNYFTWHLDSIRFIGWFSEVGEKTRVIYFVMLLQK